MLRVAYLCEFPTLLGGDRSLLTFLDQRESARINPIVVAPADGCLSKALLEQNVQRIDWPAGGRREPMELVEILQDWGVELVHANSLMTADAAGLLGLALSVPAVAHVRDMMTLSRGRCERLARLSALIAVSDAVAEWLYRAGLPMDRVTKIYNAIDGEKFRATGRRGLLREELGFGEEDPLIGCVGQICLRKGQDVFLESAAKLAVEFPKARFVIAGARYSEKAESLEFEDRLQVRASKHPLAGRVHLLGYRHQIASVLLDLDVLVVPSQQEPFSRVLLESLACGVASVATDVGGTREILTHGSTGLIVPPNDPEAIAQAVALLLTDRDLSNRLRRCGPEQVRAFSPGQQAISLRRLYDRLLQPKDGLEFRL